MGPSERMSPVELWTDVRRVFRSGDACARPEVTRASKGGVSVALQGQNKGLARIDEIWIADPFSVCSVQERIP
jgi:hypothetical protein